jgi:hypothetical protein
LREPTTAFAPFRDPSVTRHPSGRQRPRNTGVALPR